MESERAELEGDRFDASTRADAHVAQFRPTGPHYFLGAVGTRRAQQRRGFGSAVLVPVLDRAASAHVDVFLETSAADNVEFYRRLGFVTVAETTVPGGGPRVWSMTRKHPI
jgi:GNAT superfamily N-acetyltransferase